MTQEMWIVLIGAVLGSSVLATLVGKIFDFFTVKNTAKNKHNNEMIELHCNQLELIVNTLKVVSYKMLSEKLDWLLERGYATTDQRRDVQVLHDVYLDHGWNGEIEERMNAVYALPFQPPTNRRTTDKKDGEE